MKEIQLLLDGFLEQRIITGYNMFDRPINRGNYNFVLSNLHETESYVEDVKRDLKLLNINYDLQVRNRHTVFCWDSEDRFRDDNNKIYPNIIIRKGQEIIDLKKIIAQTLFEEGEEYKKGLFCENLALEINIACNLEEEVQKLAYLFNQKSYMENRNSWKDAYKTPAIIIEGRNLNIINFEKIIIFRKITTNFETSFLMLEEKLVNLPDFEKQIVYANNIFIQYIFKELNS